MPNNTPPGWASSRFDTSVPHSARIWNYWLGGKDHYPADRKAGDAYAAIFPRITQIARCSRYFLARSVRYLAADAGIRQFLDIGTGLPTVDNTHQVAQQAAPQAKGRIGRRYDGPPSWARMCIDGEPPPRGGCCATGSGSPLPP